MTDQLSRIATLNDRVRQGLDPAARIVITAACAAALAEGSDPDATLRAHGELLMAIDRCAFAADERDERRRGEVLFRGSPRWPTDLTPCASSGARITRARFVPPGEAGPFFCFRL